MANRVYSEGLTLPDGRKVRVLAYDDGSVRFRPDETPYVLAEAYLAKYGVAITSTSPSSRRCWVHKIRPPQNSAATVLLGELGLDGRVRPVRGILPAVLGASRAGFRRAIVPRAQAVEAVLVADIDIVGIGTLRDS